MLNRLRQLPADDRRQLWPAFWRLVVARAALSAGIRRSAGWLDGLNEDSHREVDLSTWRLRALALRRVGARLPGVACLTRALALRWWMRSQGIHAELIIGAQSAADGLDCHAWVEVDGRCIDHPERPAHRELQRF
jgi:hypothetical protein